MRMLLKALGWLSISFGVVMVAVEIDELRTGKTDGMAVGVVMAAIFSGGGALLLRAGRRGAGSQGQLEAPSGPSIERQVLAAARVKGGLLTPVSAAVDGDLTVEQAGAELERLAKANACLMEITPQGQVVYRFPEFERDEAKRRS